MKKTIINMKKNAAGVWEKAGYVVAGLALTGGQAMALDTTAVQTSIAAAQTDAETVGGYVIATVAALVVIGLIVSIVKKLG